MNFTWFQICFGQSLAIEWIRLIAKQMTHNRIPVQNVTGRKYYRIFHQRVQHWIWKKIHFTL